MGSYVSTTNNQLIPLLVVSHDQRQTWSTAVDQTRATAIPTDFLNGTYGAGTAGGAGLQGGGAA